MQIVIDKESLVKMLKVSLYAVTGADYEEVGKAVEELLDKVGYVELPEYHGKLSDVDEILKEICIDYKVNWTGELPKDVQECCKYMDKAKSICEATPEYKMKNYCCAVGGAE